MAALLMRASTLGVMPSARYVNAMKAMSARGWRRTEPGDDQLGTLEVPVLLGRAVERLQDLGLSVGDLCAEAALPLSEVRDLLRRTRDPRPSVDL
jgi:hypothetical protein